VTTILGLDVSEKRWGHICMALCRWELRKRLLRLVVERASATGDSSSASMTCLRGGREWLLARGASAGAGATCSITDRTHWGQKKPGLGLPSHFAQTRERGLPPSFLDCPPARDGLNPGAQARRSRSGGGAAPRSPVRSFFPYWVVLRRGRVAVPGAGVGRGGRARSKHEPISRGSSV
jgi:hypothetical protein